MIENYLMTYDDYEKVDHPVPYQYVIQKGDQYLYYFGANHSRDPENKQYEMLRTFWQQFLDATKRKDPIVLVEGGKCPRAVSEAEAIAQGAEAHLITYLAAQESIDTFSPEPPEKLRFAELLKNFSKEEIAYYEFAKVVHQWNRHHGTKPDFKEYMTPFLENDRKGSGWSDFDFSIEHMMQIEKKLFDREFNKDDMKFYYDVINPTTTFSRINEVSRVEDSGLRDKYILQQIEKFWQEGKNIFIVYGCSHAVMHEPAVRKLI